MKYNEWSDNDANHEQMSNPMLSLLLFCRELRSGHTERGLPQRTAVSVRCGMLHSKQTLLTIYILKVQFLNNKKKPIAF